MKTLEIYGSDNKWCTGILVFFILHVQFILCTTAKVEWSANLKNRTKIKNRIYDAGTESKKTQKGTAKDKIPQASVDNHDENLVFFQIGGAQKKEKARKKNSIFLKSSPHVRSNNMLNIGDGLDLARASILPRKSSPTTVTSCVGNQVTLKCAAEGNPAPEFTWYKGKEAVNREKVADFDLTIAPSLFTRASHLTLTPNGKDDFGEYQCAATNTLGATQQSMHKIVLTDQGESLCAQSTYNKDKKKYNSIIIGTVSSAGILLVLMCIAGFVFWRLNQQEADSYQRLKSASASKETLVEDGETSKSGSNTEPSFNETEDTTLHDDFNAKEIGRVSILLAGDWERLARLLGFAQYEINSIRDNSEKNESRCADMLNRFRQKHGSRENLAESVEEMKDIETATAIRGKKYKHNPIE